GIEGAGLDHGIGDAAARQILHVELGAAFRIQPFGQHAGKWQAQHEEAALFFGLGEKSRVDGRRGGGFAHDAAGGMEPDIGAGMAMEDMRRWWWRDRDRDRDRLALRRASHSQSFIYSASVGLLRSVLMATADG